MRLSRGRVALRVVLLAAGGAWMLWRGAIARSAARPLEGGDALLGSRLSLVWMLMGALALATAVSAAASLRRRPPKRTLHLDDLVGARRRPEGGHGPGRAARAADDPGEPAAGRRQ